jgi:polyadenylate-binding protein
LKISRNGEDHSSRGYGFVCYEEEEDAMWVSEKLAQSETRDACIAVKWNPKNRADFRKLFNNLYVKNYPDDWTDD